MADYKIAAASSDGQIIDSHFGHATHFYIYEVNEKTGAFKEIEDRNVNAACGGGECGGVANKKAAAGADPMDIMTEKLSDVDYVLCARIGSHAIQSLAKKGIRAYDIVLPVAAAIAKINAFRKKTTH